jgi:hypothetical protein
LSSSKKSSFTGVVISSNILVSSNEFFTHPPDYIFFATLSIEEMQGSVGDFVNRALKYLLEGLAVAVAAIYIPKRSLPLDEIAALALVAAAVFALLDVLAPSVGATARQGAGFGLGANLVGFPMRR